MARSIGDHVAGRVGVIAEPVVELKEIEPDKCAYITMASDGVWEFIESEEACSILSKELKTSKNDAQKAAAALIERATKRWKDEEGDYRDDITAFCIRVPGLFESALEHP